MRRKSPSRWQKSHCHCHCRQAHLGGLLVSRDGTGFLMRRLTLAICGSEGDDLLSICRSWAGLGGAVPHAVAKVDVGAVARRVAGSAAELGLGNLEHVCCGRLTLATWAVDVVAGEFSAYLCTLAVRSPLATRTHHVALEVRSHLHRTWEGSRYRRPGQRRARRRRRGGGWWSSLSREFKQ